MPTGQHSLPYEGAKSTLRQYHFGKFLGKCMVSRFKGTNYPFQAKLKLK